MDNKILTKREIKEELRNLPGWIYLDNKIMKEYKFNDFMDAFGFVCWLAMYFEMMDHHPDINITYDRVLFQLQRFDVGGKVTDRDVVVAKEIEKRYSARDRKADWERVSKTGSYFMHQ